MTICYSVESLQRELSLKFAEKRLAFVPTMGALHRGHLSLIERAKELSDNVVVSIFVNPTQFNSGEDFKNYPIAIERDIEKLREVGATLLFIPSVEEIYPERDERLFNLGGLDRWGEGPSRPGHFNGVVQVVTKLFNLVKPHWALFGEKDFQQLAIIKYIVKELSYPIEIISSPTVREEDGLAMSSRNLLLSREQRERVPIIYQTLLEASKRWESEKQLETKELSNWVAATIEQIAPLEVDYVEILDSQSLELIEERERGREAQLCVAVKVGKIRLIDNIKLR